MSQPHTDTGVQRTYYRLMRVEQCRLGEGTFVEFAGRELAVFRVIEADSAQAAETAEKVYVLDNACPHANGNLAAGSVKDGIVRCPWHDWRFYICNGHSAQGSVARARSYPAEIRDGEIFICLDAE